MTSCSHVFSLSIVSFFMLLSCCKYNKDRGQKEIILKQETVYCITVFLKNAEYSSYDVHAIGNELNAFMDEIKVDPVIKSDVSKYWEISKTSDNKIVFQGKNGSPYQGLFVIKSSDGVKTNLQ